MSAKRQFSGKTSPSGRGSPPYFPRNSSNSRYSAKFESFSIDEHPEKTEKAEPVWTVVRHNRDVKSNSGTIEANVPRGSQTRGRFQSNRGKYCRSQSDQQPGNKQDAGSTLKNKLNYSDGDRPIRGGRGGFRGRARGHPKP